MSAQSYADFVAGGNRSVEYGHFLDRKLQYGEDAGF